MCDVHWAGRFDVTTGPLLKLQIKFISRGNLQHRKYIKTNVTMIYGVIALNSMKITLILQPAYYRKNCI